MLKYNHPWLAYLVDHWPALILLPSLLVVMAALAVVTHYWDKRDDAARARQH